MNFILQNIKGISDLATTTNFRFNHLYYVVTFVLKPTLDLKSI